MKTLKESLLDNEEDLTNDDIMIMNNWMDHHSNDYSMWFDRDTPRGKKNWTLLKDGYKTKSVWLSIELGSEDTIPNYINFDGPKQLSINTDAKILNINSKYLKNIEKLEIFGKNISDIHITGEVSAKDMIITCHNLNVLDANKCQTNELYLSRSENLDLFKSHLPKYNVVRITQNTKDVIYDYVKKQTGIDLVHTLIK